MTHAEALRASAETLKEANLDTLPEDEMELIFEAVETMIEAAVAIESLENGLEDIRINLRMSMAKT